MTNFSLTGDESTSAVLAQMVAQGHGASFPSGIYEVRGELYWQLLGLWTKLVGLNELTLRLLSSLFGMAGIGAMYILGKAMYNKEAGLIASSFYAFSPIVVGLQRFARMYSIWMFLIIIMFYFLNKKKAWLGLVIFIISYFIHRGTVIFIPGILLAIWIRKEPILKKICYSLGLGLAIFLISMHFFQNPRLRIPACGIDTSNEPFIRLSLKEAPFYTQVLLGVRRDYVKKELGEIKKKKNYFDISRLIMFLLFWAGVMRFGRKDTLLYGAFLAGLFIISFLVSWKWERYLAGFYPFLFIGSAKGVDVLRKNFLITRYKLGGLVVIGFFFLAVNPIGNTAIFEKRFNWAPDFRAAYRYIEEMSQDGDIVVTSEAAPAVFYLGGLDYFSQEEDHMIFLYEDREGIVRERYSGKEAVTGSDRWKGVLEENERVWFITDILKFPYKFSEETVSLIYDKFNLAESFYLIKIFKYEKGIKGGSWIQPKKEDCVPLEAKFYYYSGDIRIKTGDVAGGVEGFQMSRQINPYWVLPYWRLGEIYTKVGLLEEGLKEYEKAYDYGGGDPLAAKLLGEAYIERGEKELGEIFLEEASPLMEKELRSRMKHR